MDFFHLHPAATVLQYRQERRDPHLYYGFLTISVVMFGIQFLMNNRYQKHAGSGMGATFQFAFFGNAVGLVCLLVINKFAFGFTPFTLIMALVNHKIARGPAGMGKHFDD